MTYLPLNKIVSLRDYIYTGYENVSMPTQGQNGNLRLCFKEDKTNPSKAALEMYS